MNKNRNRYRYSFLMVVVLATVICGCSQGLETPQSISTIIPTEGIEPGSNVVTSFDPWTLWTQGTQLRGANIYQRRVYPELDGTYFLGSGPVGPPYKQDDFDTLAAAGANYVNISHPGLFSENPPYELDPVIQKNLDDLLTMIAQADMFAVISFRTGPGRAEFTFLLEDVGDWFNASYLNDSVWQNAEAQNAWVAMWQYTAERYRDNLIVVGYDLMVEPNANEVWLDEWDPEVFYQDYAGSLYDWNQLHARISAAIRESDPLTPILIGGMGYSSLDWMPYVEIGDAERVVVTAHQYEPFQYTHQSWRDDALGYPDTFDTNWDGEEERFDRAWLEERFEVLDGYIRQYAVPLAINEFGVVRWAPNAAGFMDDQLALFEARGMNYAIWLWETSWGPFAEEITSFNTRLGPGPQNTAVVENELQSVLEKYWGRNSIRPSQVSASPEEATSPLADVKDWLILLDTGLDEEILQQIVESSYDVVILDFIPSEVGRRDFPMAAAIERMHRSSNPKLVLAYIDIGETEAYRTYWEQDWQIGNPAWILGDDPDGWEDNYPVAFWEDDWRAIWLGDDGLLHQILDMGYDGVYLDWVAAYEDELVIEAARRDGVDEKFEMIAWVGSISAMVRDSCDTCVIVAQNAAELVEAPEFLRSVDAIAQEHVWFDGGVENRPQGDCPLPRTEADIDTEAYRESLSPACRRQFDDYPDGTLHSSSDVYLSDLLLAQDQGLVVLTVDYALDAENIAWIVETAQSYDFVPFVGARALDRYIDISE